MPDAAAQQAGAHASTLETDSRQERTAQEISYRVSAGLRFLAPDRAELRWESNLEGPATVAYGSTRKLGKFQQSVAMGNSHSVVLEGLEPGEPIHYRIGVRHQGRRRISPFYSVDRDMNYSLPKIPPPDASPPDASPPDASPSGLDRLMANLSPLGTIAVITEDFASAWARPIAERSQMTETPIVATRILDKSSGECAPVRRASGF